jgi:hypothetical protein
MGLAAARVVGLVEPSAPLVHVMREAAAAGQPFYLYTPP